jgi:hypothetical protein
MVLKVFRWAPGAAERLQEYAIVYPTRTWAIIYIVGGCGWEPASERGVRPLDPKLKIAWPIAPPIVAERDAAWPLFGKSKERDHGDRD